MDFLFNEKMLFPVIAFAIGWLIRKYVNPFLSKLKIKRMNFDLIESMARKVAIHFMSNFPEDDWRSYLGKAIDVLMGAIKIDKKAFSAKAYEIAERELTAQFQLLRGDVNFMASLKKKVKK